MSASLRNKTALITGAGRRLGKNTAIRLGAEGVQVVLHCNKSCQETEETAALIRKNGGRAKTIQADLAKERAVETLISRVVAAVGAVDILINNASIFQKNGLDTLGPKNLWQNININALAPFVLTRSFAQQTKKGVVINMLDTGIVTYDQEHTAYLLSKQVLFSLTRMTALEYAPNIRVNAVAPGFMLPTEGEDHALYDQFAAANPLQRQGHPDDIADAILFLLQAEFITGQVLFVDGGIFIQSMTYGL
jgi:pteridine reductase